MKLENKVAIVTGAASGIGLAIANTFIKEGAQVVYSDVNELTESLDPQKAIFVKCDVSQRSEVNNLIKTTIDKFGHLDIMVNNAGIASSGSILDLDDSIWNKTLSIDLFGVFYGSQIASQIMKEQGISGSIINISSIAGSVGFASSLAYCTAKGGVEQLTRAACLDLAPYNIRINAIAPGVIITNMTKDYLADQNFKKMFEANTPLTHPGEPQDIANAALYLASDDAKYVTGSTLYVDGGWTAK